MNYSNEKIKQLIEERDATVLRFNREIANEIQKEKAKYIFSWKRFSLFLALLILPIVMFKLNKIVFPKDSIWSWEYFKYKTTK